jgi:hypothetical protein
LQQSSKIVLRKNSLLYRLVTFVLLVLFALSITPKLYLHAVFADHTDVVYKQTDGKTQVSKNGFTCDCNNQVATSPFTEHADAFEIGILSVYQSFIPHFPSQIIASTQFYFELRGPPASFGFAQDSDPSLSV